MKTEDVLALILEKLRWLKLPGMVQHLPALLEEAAHKNLTPLDVVGRLADEEKASRTRRAVQRRVKGAHFPEVNTIDAFDFDFDRVLSAGVREPHWRHPVPSSAHLSGPGETRWRDEL